MLHVYGSHADCRLRLISIIRSDREFASLHRCFSDNDVDIIIVNRPANFHTCSQLLLKTLKNLAEYVIFVKPLNNKKLVVISLRLIHLTFYVLLQTVVNLTKTSVDSFVGM